MWCSSATPVDDPLNPADTAVAAKRRAGGPRAEIPPKRGPGPQIQNRYARQPPVLNLWPGGCSLIVGAYVRTSCRCRGWCDSRSPQLGQASREVWKWPKPDVTSLALFVDHPAFFYLRHRRTSLLFLSNFSRPRGFRSDLFHSGEGSVTPTFSHCKGRRYKSRDCKKCFKGFHASILIFKLTLNVLIALVKAILALSSC